MSRRAPLHRVDSGWRADVAKTISYRRRKGTLLMLEDLAGAVTGWGARVIPFFELMEWAQYLDHLRMSAAADPGRVSRVGAVNSGDIDAPDRLGGPFDEIAHTADIRPFGAGRGRHNIKKIGFFLWRLRSSPLRAVTPRAAAGHDRAYHFSPLGQSAPLFTNRERPDEDGRAEEADLPGPIRRLALRDDLEAAADAADLAATEAAAAGAAGASAAEQQAAAEAAGADSRYYGKQTHHSIVIAVGDPAGEVADQALLASKVVVCNLADWRSPPAGKDAAIDPVRGRLTLSADAAPGSGEVLRVGYCYGFSGSATADLGGGPYDRRASLTAPADDDLYEGTVAQVDPGTAPWADGIGAAISDWLSGSSPPGHAIITVADGSTYLEADLAIMVPAGSSLELRAANGVRPVVEVDSFTVGGGGDASLVIDGLAVMGAGLEIDDGLSSLTLRHTTLVPGGAFDPEGEIEFPDAVSISATADATLCAITLANSIVGPVRVPAEGFTLAASDSIIDSPAGDTAIGGPGTEYGPACALRRVSVFGDVRVRSILYASDTLFLDDVVVERTQVGCIRFSYVSDTTTTPRRYRCQPDRALQSVTTVMAANRVRSRMQPRSTSRVYGQPGYAQLAVDAASELKTGAENEAEVGAFNSVLEAQRVANLVIRLDEYLPAGLEPGLIYVT